MKTLATAIATIVLSATVVSAQSQTTTDAWGQAEAGAMSNSGVTIEGSGPNVPGVGAPGMNHTAPCVIGHSSGVAVAGFGVSHGGGTIDDNCNTREEVKFLHNLLSQRNNMAKRVAIAHACANDKSIQQTLVAMGLCVVVKK